MLGLRICGRVGEECIYIYLPLSCPVMRTFFREWFCFILYCMIVMVDSLLAASFEVRG